MSTDYNPHKCLGLADQIVKPSAFLDYLTTVKFPSITLNQAKMALRMAQTGETKWPEHATEQQMIVIRQAVAACVKGYEDAKVIAEALKKKAEEEGLAKAVEQEKFIQAYKSVETEAIVQPIPQLLATSVALALGDNFTVDNGEITLRGGKDPYESFGTGFRNLNDLHEKSTELQEGFAITEARLAIAAEKVLGRDWPIALAGANKKDVTRIRKNKTAVLRFEAAGYKASDVPIGTIRVLTEVNYDLANEANNKRKMREVITKFFDRSKERGSYLNQLEVRDLVADHSQSTRGVNKEFNWDTFYLIQDPGKKPKLVGSVGLVDELVDKAMHVIDRRTSSLVYRIDDEYSYEPIPAFAGKPSEKAIEEQEKVSDPLPEPVPKEVVVTPAPEPDDISDLDELFD